MNSGEMTNPEPIFEKAKTPPFPLTISDQPQKKKRKGQLSTNSEMSELKIPKFLQHAYLNGIPEPAITNFREWQHDLFQRREWQEGQSAIILVPTSGGKTVAADVAIAQQLSIDPGSKCIYALPFVALASEKFNEYTKRFFSFNVRAFYQNVGGQDFDHGSIAICTYE